MRARLPLSNSPQALLYAFGHFPLARFASGINFFGRIRARETRRARARARFRIRTLPPLREFLRSKNQRIARDETPRSACDTLISTTSLPRANCFVFLRGVSQKLNVRKCHLPKMEQPPPQRRLGLDKYRRPCWL